MQIRIQRPINWVQYSVNEQIIDTIWLSKEEITAQIQQAKEFGDIVQQCYGQPSSVADFQLIAEHNELKKILEKVQTTSEQKSVLLEACKNDMGTERYDALKEATVNSQHFQKVTLHSKEAE